MTYMIKEPTPMNCKKVLCDILREISTNREEPVNDKKRKRGMLIIPGIAMFRVMLGIINSLS